MDILHVLREFGPLIGVVVFFIWRDWKRESSLSDRIVALEEQQRDVLLQTIKETTSVVERNTVVMEQNTRVMEQNVAALSRLYDVVDRMSMSK